MHVLKLTGMKLNIKFTAGKNLKVMHFRRRIVQLLFIIGMIIFACTSNNQSSNEAQEELNQVDLSGLKQGPWEVYSDTVLLARGSYLDGEPDGLWTRWYKNGQMKEEGHYKKGIKEGMWVEWYQDGEIMWKGEWENGTRHIVDTGAKAEISILGQNQLDDHVLARDSLYRLKIRIQSIPASNLFVEVSSGEITRDENPGFYLLHTSTADTVIILAIGYVPDLNFMDFRNLVSEIEFKMK